MSLLSSFVPETYNNTGICNIIQLQKRDKRMTAQASSDSDGGMPTLLAVQEFANANSIKLIVPTDSEFESTGRCFIINPAVKPLAIIRPTTHEDVSSIVMFCASRSVPFVVRNGGHDSAGRSQVDGALTIDLRDMNSVSISADRRTAKVNGGASAGDVADALGAHGLVTPVGANSTVGYVGWATCAGYGVMARSRGLGLEQILAAKLVNWEGKILDAEDDLLKGVRGAGPAFGIIVELTIKVYPLDTVRTPFNRFAGVLIKWNRYCRGSSSITHRTSSRL